MASSRLTALLALPVAVSLLLGAVSWDAQADICKKQNPKKGCVDSADVENQSLGKIEIKDEAGFKFERAGGLGQLGASDKEVAAALLTAPRKGWVVVTANVELNGVNASSDASVRCEIVGIRGSSTVLARKVFYDSVSFENGIPRGSVAATLGFKVKKGPLVARLSCRKLSGGIVRARGGGIAVQYFPTRYQAN